MSDTTTAAPSTQAASTTRKRASTRPTVSVRPVAVGALNAATIAGATAVAAGGGLVLAAAAGGAALAATAASARKTGHGKANKQTTGSMFGNPGGGGSGRGGSGGPRLGRPGSGTPGSRAGGSRPSSGGNSRSGKPSGDGSGKGAGGSGRTNRSSSATPGHRRAGSPQGSTKRAPLTADRVAAARRKLTNRREPGPRLSDAIRKATRPGDNGRKPTPRDAWRTARNAVTGNNPKHRGTVRRALAGVTAAGIAASQVAWKDRRRRKRLAAARAARNARIIARLSNTGTQGVNPTVRRASVATPTTPHRKPAPAPVPRRNQTGSTTQPNTQEGLITMVHPLLAISEDFLAAAARNEPEGMLQVTAEAHLLPQVMANFAKAMKIRFDQAQEHPLHPVIKEMYGLVHQAQMAVQRAAEDIGPAVEKTHEFELDRLRHQRIGESMWDVARNRGAI